MFYVAREKKKRNISDDIDMSAFQNSPLAHIQTRKVSKKKYQFDQHMYLRFWEPVYDMKF